MVIRFAQERDIPGMIALLQQVGEVHHQIRPDLFRAGAQKYDVPALKKLLADASRPILIADQDGKVAGYAFCILQETAGDPVLCDRKVLYIDDLCVEENSRRMGIGQAIYHEILRYAKARRCYNVTLNVWTCNPGAQKFYESLGMKPQKIGMEMRLEEN